MRWGRSGWTYKIDGWSAVGPRNRDKPSQVEIKEEKRVNKIDAQTEQTVERGFKQQESQLLQIYIKREITVIRG